MYLKEYPQPIVYRWGNTFKIESATKMFDVNFSSGGKEFKRMRCKVTPSPIGYDIELYLIQSTQSLIGDFLFVCNGSVGETVNVNNFNEQYREMTFEEEPTGELLDFLNTNCTRIS